MVCHFHVLYQKVFDKIGVACSGLGFTYSTTSEINQLQILEYYILLGVGISVIYLARIIFECKSIYDYIIYVTSYLQWLVIHLVPSGNYIYVPEGHCFSW